MAGAGGDDAFPIENGTAGAPGLALNGDSRRMPADAEQDTRTCIVRVDHEEQQSLWLAREAAWLGVPASWEFCTEPAAHPEDPSSAAP